MNDMHHISPGDDGLDPNLLDLFDAAPTVDGNDEAFVRATLMRLEKARRRRLFLRLTLTATIVVLGAILSPYVAEATLTTMDWALASPVGCACVALIAWGITRRRFS
jgi:hypothetical protein